MPFPAVVGFSGNITRPSKTRALVEHLARSAAEAVGSAHTVYDIEDIGPSFASARRQAQLDERAQRIVARIADADLLVVGTPTFKGSYTGLFKHFFDLLDPGLLRGKPVILSATGGGERHTLVVEHQLRPLFGFFEASTLGTAIYASDRDFIDGALVSEPIKARAAQAVEEAVRLVSARTIAAPRRDAAAG